MLFRRTARAAHQGCELFDVLQRKGGQGEGLQGDGHQLHGVVVGGDAVGIQLAAPAAAVNDGPLAALPDPDTDGLHKTAAVSGPVTRLLVHMQTGQTVGTVVAVGAARRVGDHRPTAYLTGEAVVTWMCFKVTFFKCFSFVLPIHGNFLLKVLMLLGGRLLGANLPV